MKQKHFYHHLLNLSDLKEELDRLKLIDKEKDELLSITHQTIHFEILNFIFEQLPEDTHKQFLLHLSKKPKDKGIKVFLERSIQGLEKHLSQIIKRVKHEFLDELEKYKQTSEEWLGGI